MPAQNFLKILISIKTLGKSLLHLILVWNLARSTNEYLFKLDLQLKKSSNLNLNLWKQNDNLKLSEN